MLHDRDSCQGLLSNPKAEADFQLPQSLRVVSHQAPSGWLTLSNRTSVTTSERKIRILRLVRLILTADY